MEVYEYIPIHIWRQGEGCVNTLTNSKTSAMPPPGDTTEHSANPKPISSAAPGITLLQPEPCGEPFCKEHTPVSQLLAI